MKYSKKKTNSTTKTKKTVLLQQKHANFIDHSPDISPIFFDFSDLWFNAKLQGVGEFRQHKGGTIRFLTNEEGADDRRMRLWLYALS